VDALERRFDPVLSAPTHVEAACDAARSLARLLLGEELTA
jgi:hypothetical protein